MAISVALQQAVRSISGGEGVPYRAIADARGHPASVGAERGRELPSCSDRAKGELLGMKSNRG